MNRVLMLIAMSLSWSLAAPAQAQEAQPPELGLAPGVPQATPIPGGMKAAFGQKPADPQEFRFDFHGMFTAPLRAGINERENPAPGQSRLVLHAPPVVPDDLETFSHTGVVPTPYAQLNFSYGNNIVTGNVFVLAKVANVSTGFFDPSAQMGINDAFLSFNLPGLAKGLHVEANVGQFSNRYGSTGEYDEGRYGTPLVARTNGAGENIVGRFALGKLTLAIEQGFQGQSDKAPAGLVPDGWNGFGDPNVGTSYVNHVHAGLGAFGVATLGLHYLRAWSQDDRATGPLAPDGSIGILGAELRLTMGRFGHLYVAASQVDADRARSVGRIVEVLNTRGGPGLMDNYLGEMSGGTGKLTIVGGQYDFSLGRLLRHPRPFNGEGPDIFLSLFGMNVKVRSDDRRFDGFTKTKLGAEGTYTLLPWLAAGARYDIVKPDADFSAYDFAVLSPRLIFRTGWHAQDQVVLQYSHWFNGGLTTVRGGYPPKEDVTIIPDTDVLSLSASMWW